MRYWPALLLLLAGPAQAQQQLPSGSPGDMIYRGASAWARLPGGTGGCPLISQGATVAATWQCDLSGSTGLKLLNQATNTVLGNNTGGTHWPIPITMSAALDTIGFDTLRPPSPGSLLVKSQNPGTWQALPVPTLVGWTLLTVGPQQPPQWSPQISAAIPGVSGDCLMSNGVGVPPTYQTCPGAGVTPAAFTKADDTNVTLTLTGTPATALLQDVTITAGWTGTLANARLANMAANTFKGNVTGSTASPTDVTFTACASDGSHALTYVNGSGFACTAISTGITPAALTVGNDTNVVLTLGGTPATSLLQAASITAGWAGSLANARLATMAANTVKGNFTSGTASPTDNTMPSCSTDGQHALTYTSGSGLNCTTITGNAASLNENIEFVIDGGGSAITTGVKGDLEVSFNCQITRARQMADQSGSIITNIWKAAFASFPPTVANKITSTTPPTITSASTSSDTTLSSWTTGISAGDILRFNVDGATTIQRVTVSLTCSR